MEVQREKDRIKGFYAIIFQSMRHGIKRARKFSKEILVKFAVEKNNIQRREKFFNYRFCAGQK
jgi:hypothetical protein